MLISLSVLADAEFVMGYGGANGSVLASAFFPNGNDLNNLYVYQLAFDAKYVSYLSNILIHELGHVLGLRHEFAPEKEGQGAIVFGPRDPLSVMSYSFPPEMQVSDCINTKLFYEYTGSSIYGVQISDQIPNN
jgi:hypothetical protein